MDFLFRNGFGIFVGIFILSFSVFITGIAKSWSSKEFILNIILFDLWYIITVILNLTMPHLRVLYENKIVYAILSIIILKLIEIFIKEKFYLY